MFCSAICRGATILQSAVVSRGSSKQDKNVGLKRVDRSRPAANNGSDSRSVQDRDPKLRVLRASVFIRVHPWLNRIQIGAALGLVVILGGSLSPRQLLTPVAAIAGFRRDDCDARAAAGSLSAPAGRLGRIDPVRQ